MYYGHRARDTNTARGGTSSSQEAAKRERESAHDESGRERENRRVLKHGNHAIRYLRRKARAHEASEVQV